jgi:hypothetical protein
MPQRRPIVVNVVIKNRRFLDVPEAVRGEPDNRVTFVLHNEDNTDWDVHILSITEKETGLAAMPLVHPIGPGHAVTAAHNDATLMRQRLQPMFAKGTALPFTSYKFTLRLTDAGGGGVPVDLDPDMDVAPPS